jgi:hypothetical protein
LTEASARFALPAPARLMIELRSSTWIFGDPHTIVEHLRLCGASRRVPLLTSLLEEHHGIEVIAGSSHPSLMHAREMEARR